MVSEEGEVLYDKFVKPLERVVDYRTAVSGIDFIHYVVDLSFVILVCHPLLKRRPWPVRNNKKKIVWKVIQSNNVCRVPGLRTTQYACSALQVLA